MDNDQPSLRVLTHREKWELAKERRRLVTLRQTAARANPRSSHIRKLLAEAGTAYCKAFMIYPQQHPVLVELLATLRGLLVEKHKLDRDNVAQQVLGNQKPPSALRVSPSDTGVSTVTGAHDGPQ